MIVAGNIVAVRSRLVLVWIWAIPLVLVLDEDDGEIETLEEEEGVFGLAVEEVERGCTWCCETSLAFVVGFFFSLSFGIMS